MDNEEITGIALTRKFISKEEANKMFPDENSLEDINKRLSRIEEYISMVFTDLRKQDEYLETILHAIHKGNDQKTVDSIRKYLGSDFRNNRNMY